MRGVKLPDIETLKLRNYKSKCDLRDDRDDMFGYIGGDRSL